MINRLKKAIAVSVLLSLLLFLFSCGGRTKGRACDVLTDFCKSYGIEAELICSCAQGSCTEPDEQLLSTVFCAPFPVGVDYALVLHSKLTSLVEVGVFSAAGGSDRFGLIPILEERLAYLREVGGEGEGFLFCKGGFVFYGFLSDPQRAVGILRALV